MHRRKTIMSTLRVFECFAGVGSQRMALRNLGIDHEVVAIAEIDKYALASYEAIHGDCPNLGDISKIDPHDIPDHDLFTYSFPCQDISLAGNKLGFEEGSGTRSSLLWECKKVIEAKKPKYLLLENVKNIVSKKNKPHFDKWLEYLADQGYRSYWKVLNAKDYGIPQNRERVFVVSIREDIEKDFKFSEGVPLETSLVELLEVVVDDSRYSITDFVKEKLITQDRNENGSYFKIRVANKKGYQEAYLGDSVNIEQPSSNTRRGRVGNKIASTVMTTCLQCVVEPTYRWKQLTVSEFCEEFGVSEEEILNNGITSMKDMLEPVVDDKYYLSDRMKRYILDANDTQKGTKWEGRANNDCLNLDIAHTISVRGACGSQRAGVSNFIIEDFDGEINVGKLKELVADLDSLRIRKLTPRECWRLMGFTDEDFDKAAAITSDSQLYKQAGNSIVVQVLESIFRDMFM